MPPGVIWKVASASGIEGLSINFAIRVSPRPFFSSRPRSQAAAIQQPESGRLRVMIDKQQRKVFSSE
eukprot:3931687-Rhodomonas_salina.1